MQMILRLHHLSHWLLERRLHGLSRLLEAAIRLSYGARIPAEARLHPSIRFAHDGLAVAIAPGSRIGARCMIGSHVVLGTRWPLKGAPVLEDDVVVHAGAKVIGPVRIGRGSIIGANAVVMADVPPYSLAMGAPAVVRRSALASETYLPMPVPADAA